MNKIELINAIAEKTNLTKTDVEKTFNAFLEVTMAQLKQGEKISIMGFLSIQTVDRKATVARNPQTGAEIKVPAKKSVKVKAGKSLLDAVNGA